MKKLIALLALLPLALPNAASAQKRQHRNTKTTYRYASHIKLTYCDLHVCNDEKPHWIGTASLYGKKRQGRRMANGNRFDYRKLTAASWGIPLGTMVRVTNLSNGKSVIVEITDRGPAHNLRRVADLSQAAAEQLDYTQEGLTTVLIQPVLVFDTETTALEAGLCEPPIDSEIEIKAAILPASERD